MKGQRVIAGATGCVGSALRRVLPASNTRWGTRSPRKAQERHGDGPWVRLNLDDPSTVRRELRGAETAWYLVHSVGKEDARSEEVDAARAFGEAAADAGVRKIVYLGGVCPADTTSKHLLGRAATGKALGSKGVPVVELRAGMVIDADSQSWQIVRDLAARLPIMTLPSWLKNRSSPVSLRDVVRALAAAEHVEEGTYALPGPELLSGREMLEDIAKLHGRRPWLVTAPWITPGLSSSWIGLVTRANRAFAADLVAGLTTDLVPSATSIWDVTELQPMDSFSDAAQRAIANDPVRDAERFLYRFIPTRRA